MKPSPRRSVSVLEMLADRLVGWINKRICLHLEKAPSYNEHWEPMMFCKNCYKYWLVKEPK